MLSRTSGPTSKPPYQVWIVGGQKEICGRITHYVAKEYLQGDKERAKTQAERPRRLAPTNMSQHYLKLLQLQDDGDDAAVVHHWEDTLKRKAAFKGIICSIWRGE